MWLVSTKTESANTTTLIEEQSQLNIEHSGIRKLTLENGLADGVKIVLSRSKRNSVSTVPKGRYKLTIKHMNTLKSTFVNIDSDAHIVCEHEGNNVECTQNNRAPLS